MSDFWDTFDQLTTMELETTTRLRQWDETPSHTREAMTSGDWWASSELSGQSADRHGWLSENLGSWLR